MMGATTRPQGASCPLPNLSPQHTTFFVTLAHTVREAVDNSLDACEEAHILPEIHVTLEHLADIDENRYRITTEDNGPAELGNAQATRGKPACRRPSQR